MQEITEISEERKKKIHHLAKKIWKRKAYLPIDIRNKCLERWDEMKHDIESPIIPLVRVSEERSTNNLIFGSGSFSTGDYQVQQYKEIGKMIDDPPIQLQGIVSNKSEENGCNGKNIAQKHGLEYIELDFGNWYLENIDKHEKNPIRATRYWYSQEDENKPSLTEINSRFKIRQRQYHAELGEQIEKKTTKFTDIVSLRGYNFQVCSDIFKHQTSKQPHYNDTHPADLTYIDKETKNKMYAGWQSGAIQMMIDDKVHKTYRGSLIEVKEMNNITQINELDEGALMGIGMGVTPPEGLKMSAREIQNAMKILDDYFFCTWEATGLILLIGITKKPVNVVFQDLNGRPVVIKQRAIVMGDKYHSGINAWGQDLDENIEEIEHFLLE